MISRARAFTLVELVVAVTVSTAVLAMAIPRYNDLSRQQDFIATSHTLVECLREGLRRAVTPSDDSTGRRWSVVELALGESAEFTSCTLSYLSAAYTFDALQNVPVTAYTNTEDQPLDEKVVGLSSDPSIEYQSAGTSQLSNLTGQYAGRSLYFYFGVLEKGALVRIVKEGEAVPGSYSSGGVSLRLPIVLVPEMDFEGVIRIPKTGAPIQLTRS